MTDYEICCSYRSARYKKQQIQILAELNGTDSLDIIRILVRSGEELPECTVNKLHKQLDSLDRQIREKEREYKAVVAALDGKQDM